MKKQKNIDEKKELDPIQKLPENIQTKLFDFINSIPQVKFFKPDGKPKKEWKIFYGDTWASAWESAQASAWDSALASAHASAWDSARDSAQASAWACAEDSARVSARASARDSARDFKGAFTRDFSLKAEMIVVSDLNYKDKAKHERHVNKRIEVWKKGYGLLCDVDGVLYVYAKKGTKPLLS